MATNAERIFAVVQTTARLLNACAQLRRGAGGVVYLHWKPAPEVLQTELGMSMTTASYVYTYVFNNKTTIAMRIEKFQIVSCTLVAHVFTQSAAGGPWCVDLKSKAYTRTLRPQELQNVIKKLAHLSG